MSYKNTTRELAGAIVGPLCASRYKAVALAMGSPYFDASRIGDSGRITRDLRLDFERGSLPVSRELHITPSGAHHFLIAHLLPQQGRSPDDLVTDPVPWNFPGGEKFTGYLHASRSEIQGILFAAGAPEECIALRGIGTIVWSDYLGLNLPNIRQE